MSIKKFKHINAITLDEATSSLRLFEDKALVIAGGTDVIGTLRFEVLRTYPEVVINLKTIPGLDYIKKENDILKIGALTRLEDIAQNAIVKGHYTALAQAACRTASPHVREMGTIGGNICQLIRCWYFRKEDNRFDCMRKGVKSCYATIGDNRYHSIFGATRVCPPPCITYCQAGNDIPSYLSQIREDDLPQAARTLLNTNSLSAITGRVCPHYCERNCNRNELDEAISIRSIERYVGDYMLDNAKELLQSPSKKIDKKVAIVGSGPAGLTSAYFLRKLGYGVTVFETMGEAGGMLTYGIPPYRLPNDVVRKLVVAIQSMGVQFKSNIRVGMDNIKRVLITVDSKTQATSMAKVFAGGDATTSGPLSVVAAVAAGRQAAEAINQYLGDKIPLHENKPLEHLVRSNDNLQEKLSRVPTPMLSQSA